MIVRERDFEGFLLCCETLEEEKVEFRVGTAGGGNQARQPYLESYDFREHPLNNTNHIHDYGLYIGNHPELTTSEIKDICSKLNNIIQYEEITDEEE